MNSTNRLFPCLLSLSLSLLSLSIFLSLSSASSVLFYLKPYISPCNYSLSLSLCLSLSFSISTTKVRLIILPRTKKIPRFLSLVFLRPLLPKNPVFPPCNYSLSLSLNFSTTPLRNKHVSRTLFFMNSNKRSLLFLLIICIRPYLSLSLSTLCFS